MYCNLLLSKHKYRLGREWIERSPEEKDLTVFYEKLDISWKCALTAQKASSVMGCTKNSMTSRAGEVILPLCSALMRTQLESCA